MDLLVSLFVGKPLVILLVAALFMAGDLALRSRWRGVGHQPRSLRIAAFAWGIYAGWEWLVLRSTPGADIRVDLLLIWPLLVILSAWSLWRAFR
jgi:hypothetical protein